MTRTRRDRDPVDELTIAELDNGSRLIKTDMLTAVSTDSPARPAALAVTAWLLARRTERSAQLNTYRAMTVPQLMDDLGLGDDDDVDEPAGIVVTDVQLANAAVELGIDVVDLANALTVEPVDVVDQAEPTDPVDDQLEQLESDPTEPAPERSSPGAGEPTR